MGAVLVFMGLLATMVSMIAGLTPSRPIATLHGRKRFEMSGPFHGVQRAKRDGLAHLMATAQNSMDSEGGDASGLSSSDGSENKEGVEGASSSSSGVGVGGAAALSVERANGSGPDTTKSPKGPSPGVFSFFKRLVLLSVIMLKMSTSNASNAARKLLGMKVVNTEEKERKRKELSPLAKKISAAATKISRTLITRKFWMQLGLIGFSGSILRRYMAYVKSLTTEISYAEFLKLVKATPDKIEGLQVSPTDFMFTHEGKKMFSRIVKLNPATLDRLVQSNVNFSAAPAPLNVFGLVWTCCYAYFLWNLSSRMSGPQDEGAGKRKDKALAGMNTLSFADIAGQERAKVEVQEVCQMLKFPQAYAQVGARLPAGVLLVGPPGTGKTLLARVAAAEAGVPFYACSATDFVEVFVGRGPSRVRKLFEQAATNAPSIVFIDEIDSLGRSRRMGSLNSEQENTLNQLLTSMDGLDTSNNGVIVMAATNRYELLDPALLRAGRFDRIIECPLPDKVGREAILKVHTRKLRMATDIDLEKIARVTAGCCGADLSALVNEAAIRAARRQDLVVNNADFEDALRSFFSGRGIPLSGIAEAASNVLPSWLSGVAGKGRGGVPDEGKAMPAA